MSKPGSCPSCGKKGTLSTCKNCNTTKCFSCWQKSGGTNQPCPSCGKKGKIN